MVSFLIHQSWRLAHHPSGPIGTRIALILADTIVVAVTWRKTYQQCQEAMRLGMRARVSAVLLRDGV